MNTVLLLDLFNVGYKRSSAPQYVQTVSSLESNLVVLGRNFAKHDLRTPAFIFLDNDRILNISEDMIKCYGVFAKGQNLLLIDQYGQIIEIRDYPSNMTAFPISNPHLVMHASARNLGRAHQ